MIVNVQEKLDKAMHAYPEGIDRAVYTYFEKDTKKRNELWGDVLTIFAESQLYAQMAITTLERFGAVDDYPLYNYFLISLLC